MSDGRLQLFVCIFDGPSHESLVLRSATAGEMIGAILEEFRSVNRFLTHRSGDYQLWCPRREMFLDNQRRLVNQGLRTGDYLYLREKLHALFADQKYPSRPIYLVEKDGRVTYPVRFVPGAIGRKAYRPDDVTLVVDLTEHATSQKVSRRQAVITEAGGRFYLRATADNPIHLNGMLLATSPHVLHDRDEILLVRSGICFQVLWRDDDDLTD